MKNGDTFPVTINGAVVAQAIVERVESDRVTLVIPATQVVMGVRTELDAAAPDAERDSTGTETVIAGVERVAVASENNDTQQASAEINNVSESAVGAQEATSTETVALETQDVPTEGTPKAG